VFFFAPSAVRAESGESLFIKANGVFQGGMSSPSPQREEKVEQAASLYERIIKGNKIRNGYLYYNLGNCYFHLGQIGKAILNYRRAEKFIPNYSDLKQNVKSAEARRKDQIQKKQIRSISRTLFFWHYLLSLRAKVVVSSLLFSTIWMILLVKLFWNRPLVKWGLGVCIFFSMIFGGSAALAIYTDHSTRYGVILAETITPRKGPGESYRPSFKEPLHEGTEFRVLDQQGQWLYVELDNGASCWVHVKDIELI